MRYDDTPRTDRPAGAVEPPLPGEKSASNLQDYREHLVDAAADMEDNELHVTGHTCARCGRPIRPGDDVRRTASGHYEHEVCPAGDL